MRTYIGCRLSFFPAGIDKLSLVSIKQRLAVEIANYEVGEAAMITARRGLLLMPLYFCFFLSSLNKYQLRSSHICPRFNLASEEKIIHS